MSFFFENKDNTNKALIEKIIMEKYNQYYRLAYSYVHNEEDAGDIVQNGAYKALRNSHSLHKPEFAETWIYRIMLNECFRYLKQPSFISYEDMQEEQGLEIIQIEDNYPNIDLQKALDTLPQKDKAIIILKYFEDKKLDEIACILAENVNTVKSRLYRSLKKLQEALSDEVSHNEKELRCEKGR